RRPGNEACGRCELLTARTPPTDRRRTMIATSCRSTRLALFTLALTTICAAPLAAQGAGGPWVSQSGATPGSYADVNGIKLYYEIHGTGRPLVLLHGGLGAGSMFGENLAALAKNRSE